MNPDSLNPDSSFRELRRDIGRLAASLEQPASAVERDSVLLTRALRVASLLQRVRPVVPACLRDADFLAEIFDRATRDSARAMGPSVLGRAFAPTPAPDQIAWVEDPDQALLTELMPMGLPHTPRGLPRLLTRRPTRRVSSRAPLVAAAAAILVAAGAFVAFRGTSRTTELVFVVASEPLSAVHPSDFMRGLTSR